MAPLPYSDSVAKIAFYVVVGVFAVLEWRIRLRSHLNREGSRSERVSLAVLYITIGGGVGGGALVANWSGGAITGGRWAVFIVGLVVMVIGIVIRQWAIITLGRFFTTDVRLQSGQTVVEGGPYRWVRHPSYTGMSLTLIGIGLVFGNWAAVVVLFVVPTAGLIVRIHYEERVLFDGLGEPYRRFAATRKRLVPGVW